MWHIFFLHLLRYCFPCHLKPTLSLESWVFRQRSCGCCWWDWEIPGRWILERCGEEDSSEYSTYESRSVSTRSAACEEKRYFLNHHFIFSSLLKLLGRAALQRQRSRVADTFLSVPSERTPKLDLPATGTVRVRRKGQPTLIMDVRVSERVV